MNATDGSAMIRTEALTKSYGDALALAPLDLTIAAGERIGLVGHNGSGKTTLIRMLAGLSEPTGGRATIGGAAAGSPEARAALSYLADQPVFYDDLSVWQHVEYVARLHHTVDWEDHAAHLVDRVGLTQRVDDLPVTFSRGLRQKAAIVLAFVRPFDVIVIDEPFVGLDQAGRAALIDLVDWVHGDGATVVMATHELTGVGATSRVLALRDGTLVHDGPATDDELHGLTNRALPDPDDED